MWEIFILLILSAVAFFITDELIPNLTDLFVKAGLFGIDLCKTSKKKIPEAIGVVSGCVFLITSFLFIPIVFGNGLMDTQHFPHNEIQDDAGDLSGMSQSSMSLVCKQVALAILAQRTRWIKMPQTDAEQNKVIAGFYSLCAFRQVIGAIDCTHIRIPKVGGEVGQYYINRKGYSSINVQFAELLAGLLSICCMLLLGFADDVLDLRWRYKLLLPTVASLPLLVVYYVNFNSTTFVVPIPLRQWLGVSINIGVLYYIYMGMLAVFCTNAINILAGINGLEVGQSVVIAFSIVIFDIIELRGDQYKAHTFSLHIMIPYLATTLALLKHNWYPSKVFVGDTFCYVSGMTFAVVAILSHFSKTVLLFFLPQIINFLYSVPQLFHIIPCPRHRLPKYSEETDLLHASRTIIAKKEMTALTKLILRVLTVLHLIDKTEDKESITINNMTLINLFLIKLGPIPEVQLTTWLMAFQIVCTCVAFVIRYPLASYFYDS